MEILLQNTDTVALYVRYGGRRYRLEKNEQLTLMTDERGEVEFELCHETSDQLNSFWYVMSAVFALEQMRTVLVVDGVYTVRAAYDRQLIRVRSHAFHFHRHTSYEGFVFHAEPYCVTPKGRSTANADKVKKRARWLYLFGGIKTIFRIADIGLLAILGNIVKYRAVLDLPFTLVLFAISAIGWTDYIVSRRFLSRAVRSSEVERYFNGGRREKYRTKGDELAEKNRFADSPRGDYR